MKKFLLIFAALILTLSTGLFSSCSDDDKNESGTKTALQGTYTYQNIDDLLIRYEGANISAKTLSQWGSIKILFEMAFISVFNGFTVTFYENGTTMVRMGGESDQGTYTYNNGRVTLKDSYNDTFSFKFKDGSTAYFTLDQTSFNELEIDTDDLNVQGMEIREIILAMTRS